MKLRFITAVMALFSIIDPPNLSAFGTYAAPVLKIGGPTGQGVEIWYTEMCPTTEMEFFPTWMWFGPTRDQPLGRKCPCTITDYVGCYSLHTHNIKHYHLLSYFGYDNGSDLPADPSVSFAFLKDAAGNEFQVETIAEHKIFFALPDLSLVYAKVVNLKLLDQHVQWNNPATNQQESHPIARARMHGGWQVQMPTTLEERNQYVKIDVIKMPSTNQSGKVFIYNEGSENFGIITDIFMHKSFTYGGE